MTYIYTFLFFVLIIFMKAVRDVDSFRFQRSIFAGSKFLTWFHNREGVIDLWHTVDGAIIVLLWVAAIFIQNPMDNPHTGYRLLTSLLTGIPFWALIYRPFNFFYHWLLMTPKNRDWIQRKKF